MTRLIPWRRNETQSTGNMQMAPVSQMRWDWDRLFDRFLDDAWGSPSMATAHDMLLDVSETDEQIRVRAEVPGINPDDLNISLMGNVLTLSGQKVDEEESEQAGRYYSERRFGSFERAVKLPCAVDPDRVDAAHRNGVVTITLQKSETVRPKRIKVKST